MQDKMNKLVSVVIPTYNLADLVGETIQSVLDQDYKPIEIIVVDDCSTDNTLEVLKQFKDIKVYSTEKNSERCYSRNYGAKKATGFYLKWLDHDDLLTPNCISSQVSFMESHPKIDCVFSDLSYFKQRKNKKVICGIYYGSDFNWNLREAMIKNLQLPPKLDRSILYLLNKKGQDFKIPASSLLLKKKIFDSGVKWDENKSKIVFHQEDHDFYLNMVFSGFALAHLKLHALKFRSHPRQTTKRFILTLAQALEVRKYIFEKYKSQII